MVTVNSLKVTLDTESNYLALYFEAFYDFQIVKLHVIWGENALKAHEKSVHFSYKF